MVSQNSLGVDTGVRRIVSAVTWVRSAELTAARFAPLPLRLVAGIGFLVHGLPKVFDRAQHASFVGTLDSLSVPMPSVMAWVVGLSEVIGGALLLVGAATMIACAVLIIDMVVAALLVHAPSGFSTVNIVGMGPNGPIFGMPGFETNLLYIAILGALFISGAGALSIDDEITRTRRTALLDEGEAVITPRATT
jgi:putative oxidoreductase